MQVLKVFFENFNFIRFFIPQYLIMKESNFNLINIKPVLCGYIEEARQMLLRGVPDEKVIHDVRVLMKKSRASVKLLKTQTDEAIFKREYSAFREVGRIMSGWRENSVHRKLLKDLKRRFPELFSRLKDNENINLLTSMKQLRNEPPPEMKNDIEKVIGILHKSAFRIRFRDMNNPDQKLIREEIEMTFTNVSACFLKARNYTRTVNLHMFRKRIKDFLYQLYFFRHFDPKAIKRLEKRIDALGQNLGKYNDYAVLIKSLGYNYSSGGNNSALDELIVIIRQEQDKYLSKIWPSAFRIFRPGKGLADLPGFKVANSIPIA
jgi:CHAD domain-containing protein